MACSLLIFLHENSIVPNLRTQQDDPLFPVLVPGLEHDLGSWIEIGVATSVRTKELTFWHPRSSFDALGSIPY